MSLFRNKLVLLVLVGVAMAGVVWYSFMRDDTEELLVTQDLTAATTVDGEVVNALLQLRSITLSGTIFTDPAFLSLQDFGREVVPEPKGRPNPFAPLGNVRVATSSASQPPAQTPSAPAR